MDDKQWDGFWIGALIGGLINALFLWWYWAPVLHAGKAALAGIDDRR